MRSKKTLPSKTESVAQSPALSRRRFIQSAALAAGGGLAFKDSLLPQALFALPVAAGTAYYLSGDRIAATPAYEYRAYRSKAAASADAISWVQVDLEAEQPIEVVKIYPANQTLIPGKDQDYIGMGFPLRFKIEVSNQSNFSQPRTIVDLTNADIENPQDNILRFRARNVTARYVRLTVTRFPRPLCASRNVFAPESEPICETQGTYWFALSKIGVISHGKDVAIGRKVAADQTHGNPNDLAQLTRTERIETEYIYRDHPEYVTDAATWKRVTCAAQAPLRRGAPWRRL